MSTQHQSIVELHVHEGSPIIGGNPDDCQAVTVTRTSAGNIAVLLTPDAADQLAQILQRHEELTTAAAIGDVVARPRSPRIAALQPLSGFDERLWFQAAIDLVTSRVLATGRRAEPILVPQPRADQLAGLATPLTDTAEA